MAEGGEVIKGDGFSVSSRLVGEGYGFRKLRRELDVKEFGINAIVLPPGYDAGRHMHEQQEELYFVHRGKLEITFDDTSTHVLEEGGAARVDAPTVRRIKNGSDSEDVVYVIVGAKGGYVGRDGKLPEGEPDPRRPEN